MVMKENFKGYIWIVVLLFLSVSTFAIDTQIGDKSYTINFPKNDYYFIGQASRVYVQVQNCTGLFLDNATVSCRFQVYNTTGAIISAADMTFDAPYNFYFDLPDSINTRAGTYPYDVYCNSSCCGGFASSAFKIAEGDEKAIEYPISLSLTMGLFLLFVMFLAAYFTMQKHPLSYLFMLLAFVLADVLVWLNWRVLSYNSSPFAQVFWVIFLSFALVTVIMFFVTMFDVTRLVIQMQQRKKAKENIARFGYA